jgi:hypothetical protein
MERASKIAHEILEMCKQARKQASNEKLHLQFLKKEVELLNLIGELDRIIAFRTIAESDLESRILQCAREAFPSEYFNKFVERWKESASD